MTALRKRDVPYIAVNLEPPFGSISDYATPIETAVRNVRFDLLLGSALVVVVLFLFLFNTPTAFICATAIPTSLLGAVLVSLADTVGRTVIAPAQVPAGLVTAMVGTPYFVYLLWRSRR